MSKSNNDFFGNKSGGEGKPGEGDYEEYLREFEGVKAKKEGRVDPEEVHRMEHDNGASIDLGGKGKGPSLRDSKQEIARLREALADMKAKQDELETRHVADVQNLVRRHQGEIKIKRENAVAEFASEFLRIVDVFDLALNDPGRDYDTLRMGLEMIYKNIMDVFAASRIKEIPVKPGDRLDIKIHSAVKAEDREDCDPDTILSVVNKGYVMGDRVLRHVSVVVSKLPDEEPPVEPEEEDEDWEEEDRLGDDGDPEAERDRGAEEDDSEDWDESGDSDDRDDRDDRYDREDPDAREERDEYGEPAEDAREEDWDEDPRDEDGGSDREEGR